MKYFDYSKLKAQGGDCGSIKESITENIGFARAEMRKGLSTAHYHKKLTEHYLVVEGKGTMRIKTKGKIQELELKPEVIVQIEPGEIHQTKTPERLVVEVITQPVWTKDDEIVVEKNLFDY
jgi:mannose-6-phosphate isomerase-like protein (cupin superfamily)